MMIKDTLTAKLYDENNKQYKHPLGGCISPLNLCPPLWRNDYSELERIMREHYRTIKIISPKSWVEIEYKVWDGFSETFSCLATYNSKGFFKH